MLGTDNTVIFNQGGQYLLIKFHTSSNFQISLTPH